MKKLLLAVVVSMAVASLPAFAHHPAEDNENMDDETWESIDENLEEVESPHLDLTFDDVMGSSDETGSDDGTAQTESGDSDDAMDREMDGDQTSSGDENGAEDAGEDNDGLGEDPQNQVVHYRPGVPGVVVPPGQDQESDLEVELTETTFSTEVSTPSGKNGDGGVKLKEGDRVRIGSQLVVDDEDVGKSASCLAVVQYKSKAGEGEPSTFMLSDEGWDEWGGNIPDLEGVPCQLQKQHTITAHDDELFPGEFNFYFGYKTDDGKLVVNPESLSFSVSDTTTD